MIYRIRSLHSNRGSLLVTAMIFAAIIALTLGSYLALSLNSVKLANRAFHMNAAQNLLDTGFEQTVWTLNDAKSNPSTNWTRGGFTAVTGGYSATFPATGNYSLSGGATGTVKVFIEYNATTEIYHAIGRATVVLGDKTTLIKVAECYLEQRSWSEKGMVSKRGITFTGNTKMDSWTSRPTPSDDIPYSVSVRTAEATIASPAMISVQNADIFGYVYVGTDNNTGISVGATGRVVDSWTKNTPAYNGVLDPDRITYDFTASFPDIEPIPVGTATASIAGPATLTTDGAILTMSSITLSGVAGGETLQIGMPAIPASGSTPAVPAVNADVTIVVTGDVTMGGSSQIVVSPGSTLTMYVKGDFQMGGTSGILNGTASAPNNPDSFTLLGTKTAAEYLSSGIPQNWDLRGAGHLSAVIVAPNADVSTNGGTDIYGSLMGDYVTIVGGGNFHQDLSLKGKRVSGLWRLRKWRELSSAADRATYAAKLAL